MFASWRTPEGREARNEQRKLRATIANGVALTMIIAALVGPYVNPALAGELTLPSRIFFLLVGVGAHLFAAYMVRGIEDR